MPTSERQSSPEQEGKNLNNLLHLINTPASKQQLPSIELSSSPLTKQTPWPLPQPKSGAHQLQSTESVALEKFRSRYQSERNFSQHPQSTKFSEVFTALIKYRLCCEEWIIQAPPKNIFLLLSCLRILMRDLTYQKQFYQLNGLKSLSDHFQKATQSYLRYGESPYIVDILKEMSNIIQKISAIGEQREWLIEYEAHNSLVLLLHASDVIVLHCSLYALIGLAQSSKPRQEIGMLNCIEILLIIVQEYDNLSKKLAAKLLQFMCQDTLSRDSVMIHDGIPILLSQLHSDNVNLLWHVVWCLAQLCEDPVASKEIRQIGGIPLLLSLLHDRTFVTERMENSEGPASAGAHGRTPVVDDAIWETIFTKPRGMSKSEELMEIQYSLKSASCAALMELVLNDANGQHIILANGLYYLGLLILPPCKQCVGKERKWAKNLQRNAFRALRFTFSMERNRRLFKRLFPPDLFDMFISVGHYIKDLSAYKSLVEKINSYRADIVEDIKTNIMETNHNRTPNRYIGDYAVFELLGSGAFGSVFKVKKQAAGQQFLALKEINIDNPSFGKNSLERDQSVGEIMNEIAIIKEQMKHPNVVRFLKTFVESQKLYIVMELIDGVPLEEHLNNLKDKNELFAEDRIWKILMQMVLALRYLHKEKGILHRDLAPKNIMLGENDKVTITDFGLAKQKRSDCSKMTSVVGTIVYWCPEIVQNQPYGEKADVWALGCILYQMCMLKPPFYSDNMLSLVTKICSASYDPIPSGTYTDRLINVAKTCICESPEKRPDIVEVASTMADKLMVHIDSMATQQSTMEKKLEKERNKAQRHYFEANQNMQNYHRLFVLSQERYDRLANLAGSGGASDLKDAEILDPAFVDIELLRNSGCNSQLNQDLDDNERVSGWTSDDDDSYNSSENDSRENSAGSQRSLDRSSLYVTHQLPKPPRSPKVFHGGKLKKSKSSITPLNLDIPWKSSRDSGLSSGDPSPNNSTNTSTIVSLDPLVNGHLQGLSLKKYHRSNSSPAVNVIRSNKKKVKRPNSANTPTLTISQRRVRQISDPILQMLHQLHKILYITQLPPTLRPHTKRRMIERFKRALFASHSTTFNLKSELKKLMCGSREVIDLNLGPVDSGSRSSSTSSQDKENMSDGETRGIDRLETNQCDPDNRDGGVTYEQMQYMIESVLKQCGYYNVSPSTRERTPPLGPIRSEITNSRHFETPR
ncbi:serine/threonine-protein kinase Nek10-like isoform X1 [Mytilus californianus]|uniref:serine/threonine-protein kinase Nek10-like isoform X1 n=1 Tax=Mytilus californianus TaxID=6549 RepID=UPI0022451565|nr:serine/threonine-protein kinase Nek10-like isoform X1 [Mytilus californianus]